MGGVPVITGYYRYTDIWFDWHKALPNPEDSNPLKAALSHDSITHPDHPLHVEGVEGVQLYMGTLHTGESRLLFSSAQVDYVRYWLHAMKLTNEMIPLPYSDCLLTLSDLKFVSKVTYPDGSSLRGAIKAIDKMNKKLKGNNPTLAHRRQIFEQARSLWDSKRGSWLAIDFENWERENKLITEFGWRLIQWNEKKEVETHGHWIVQEHETYRNGTYVPDRRYNYNFGASEKVTKATLRRKTHDLIAPLAKEGPLYLVFHDHKQDIKYLESLEAPIDSRSIILPDPGNTPTTGIFVVDTTDLFAALEGEDAANNNKRSLEQVCRHLRISTENLHNAGNDAYYTLEAARSMASGGPVDLQREERWPNRTEQQGVKVKWKPWEESSDYSDEEGILGDYPVVIPPEGLEGED
ncbi:hypothetical protein BDN72DRAFT_785842 [Pluteus cervinus]|uniref:Uncharacterized protein n=1 Tax=Pluteus cervinus TaxID=181527 RepID=A0ACD3BFM1_9AGAR|nr:hypothetical protein BDN72DRAFT_785842 [Pluteus cervinus]